MILQARARLGQLFGQHAASLAPFGIQRKHWGNEGEEVERLKVLMGRPFFRKTSKNNREVIACHQETQPTQKIIHKFTGPCLVTRKLAMDDHFPY